MDFLDVAKAADRSSVARQTRLDNNKKKSIFRFSNESHQKKTYPLFEASLSIGK